MSLLYYLISNEFEQVLTILRLHIIRNEGEFIILSKLTVCFQFPPGTETPNIN